jgi:hypothetical protein
MAEIEVEVEPAVKRLTRDLKKGLKLTEKQARYLVDTYYMIQKGRVRSNNQVSSMEDEEPSEVVAYFADQSEVLENQIKSVLDTYSQSSPVGVWLRSNYGIGPVIAAGLMAHIDIKEAETAGHIWSYAGYDPTTKWEKGEKRPWNTSLKTVCWKAGQSFMKFHNEEECYYGKVYKDRKDYEVKRNEAGLNAARAKDILSKKNFDKKTDAYKAYIKGKLPPAHVDAQARRYAVKLFLSHLQLVWTFIATKKLPAKPYAIGQMDHTHFDPPPNLEVVPGLVKAMKKKHWI